MKQTTITMPAIDYAELELSGVELPSLLKELEANRPLEYDLLKKDLGNIPDSAQFDPSGLESVKGVDRNIAERSNFILDLCQNDEGRAGKIRLSHCSNFMIRGGGGRAEIRHHEKFHIEIHNCDSFFICGALYSGGRNVVFIDNSKHFSIERSTFSGAEGYGIIVYDSHHFMISDCSFFNLLASGILVIGNSYCGKISNCNIQKSRGYFNHDAAIHLCNISEKIGLGDIPDEVHESVHIAEKKRRPRQINIKNCTAAHCRAQGIYLEGAVNCIIEECTLLWNNKEGICFDWGSCYNYFVGNTVCLNGERRNLSKDEIKVDCIEQYPLLKDGSSSIKLPGISIDNGSVNFIGGNHISGNYGGGIKLIRSALFNHISDNSILHNAIGANIYTPNFHGITILGLGEVNDEFDSTGPPLLEFGPSILNTITRNTLEGHGESLFCGSNSMKNTFFENTIIKRQRYPSSLGVKILSLKGYVLRLLAGFAKRLK